MTQTRNSTTFRHIDRAALVAMVALIALIGVTVVLGDRVGVRVERAYPVGEAHSTSPIILQFDNAMQRDTVESRLRVDPAIEGVFGWTANAVSFRPSSALTPGSSYTVTLDAGALGQNGRAVLSAYQFSFTVQRPRVAYLLPADGFPQNIWIADPLDPAGAAQITFAPDGVYDYDVSPDGTRIAFSEANTLNGIHDIKLLDLDTGALTQLTNCVDASCTNPVWRPDGRVIAYERIEYNSEFSVGSSPTRVWLLDVTTTPATTRPLFADSQILGYDPQWSADGQRIALMDRATSAILVYDFNTEEIVAVPNLAGTSGALSPDGRTLIFPDIVFEEGAAARETLRLAEIDTGAFRLLTDPNEPIDDKRARWSFDGAWVAVARQDHRVARGVQLYLYDPVSEQIRLLTDDPRYSNMFFRWDPTGAQIVIQRFPELTDDLQPNTAGRPEIWTLDVATRELTLVASNAFLPRWIP